MIKMIKIVTIKCEGLFQFAERHNLPAQHIWVCTLDNLYLSFICALFCPRKCPNHFAMYLFSLPTFVEKRFLFCSVLRSFIKHYIKHIALLVWH